MILQGRGISSGVGKGIVVISEKAISFLGGVNPLDGSISDSQGSTSVKGKVFAFPRGRGSTVGSYTMLEMKRNETLPAAIINSDAEPIVATGAVMSGVPLVDRIDLSLLRQDDVCIVDGRQGSVEIHGVNEIKVVTCLLQHKDKILMLKRSDMVGSFQGKWAGVSGLVEEGESAMQAALRELEEETGVQSPTLMRVGTPVRVRDGSQVWTVYPFLFNPIKPKVTLDWEHTEYRWLSAKDAQHLDTVPALDKVLKELGLPL